MGLTRFYPHTRRQLWATSSIIVLFLIVGGVFVFIDSPLFQLSTAANAVQLSVTGEELEPEDTMVFSEEDIEFMNRAFTDREHEVAYCGVHMQDESVEISLADTVEAGEDFVRFRVDTCPFNMFIEDSQKVNVHTHPGGTPFLSIADREVLLESDFGKMCVQYGEIVESSFGGEVSGLNCFSDEGVEGVSDDFPELSVRVD